MTGLFFAWAAGEAIIFWRWGKLGAPPTPGVLALSSGLFLGLAVIGDTYKPSRPVITAFAFAVDLAILMQVLGKPPSAVTGWPPNLINDPTVILPPGGAGSSASGAASAPGGAAATAPGNQGAPSTGSTPGLPTGSRGAVLS